MSKKSSKSDEDERSEETKAINLQLVKMMQSLTERFDKLEDKVDKSTKDLERSVHEMSERSGESSGTPSASKKRSEEFKTWMGFMSNFIAALERIPRQDSSRAVDDTVARYKLEFEVVKEFGFNSELLDEKDKGAINEALKNAKMYKAIGKASTTANPKTASSSTTSGGERGRSKFKEGTCYRCGRNNHWVKDCNARTTVDGKEIDDEASREYKKKKKGSSRSSSREKKSKKKD